MGLEILKDRVPTKPNRRKITFDDGAIKYGVIEMADEPIEEGTAVNKDTFLDLRATKSEMESGISDKSYATPLGTIQSIDFNRPYASENESIAGTDTNKIITSRTNLCKLGDITSSIRRDFDSDLANGKYVECNGQILNKNSYPELSNLVTLKGSKILLQGNSVTANWRNILLLHSGRILASDATGNLYKSDNDGGTWTLLASFGDNLRYIYQSKKGIIYTSRSGLTRYSLNNGDTWITIPISSDIYDCAEHYDGTIFLAGTHELLWYSTDGINFLSKPLGLSYMIDQLRCTKNGNLICTIRDGRYSRIYTSSDKGSNWTLRFSSSRDSFINQLTVSPSTGVLYCMVGSDLYKSSDYGINWTYDPISNRNANSLISCNKNGVFILATPNYAPYINTDDTAWNVLCEYAHNWSAVGFNSNGQGVLGVTNSYIYYLDDQLLIPNLQGFYMRVK